MVRGYSQARGILIGLGVPLCTKTDSSYSTWRVHATVPGGVPEKGTTLGTSGAEAGDGCKRSRGTWIRAEKGGKVPAYCTSAAWWRWRYQVTPD